MIHINFKFINACIHGKLCEAQILHSNNPNFNILVYKQAFRETCYLEVAKWLLSVKPEIQISQMHFAFQNACLKGPLDIAQWLLSVKPNINISQFNDRGFRDVCVRGYLEFAQWLLSLKPDINISVYNEEIFRYVCWQGHLHVAQWMLSVKPDIDIEACNNQAFQSSCEFLHTPIAQWLVTLKPFLYKIVCAHSYEIRFYIRDRECKRWETRKYALWMRNSVGAGATVFYKIPQDVSRHVVQMFL